MRNYAKLAEKKVFGQKVKFDGKIKVVCSPIAVNAFHPAPLGLTDHSSECIISQIIHNCSLIICLVKTMMLTCDNKN